jgi:DNA-directed RNA polymerase subunit omega
MARITAEDCREVVNNSFELVLIASQRAKELSKGAVSTVEHNRDKNPVIALREIACQSIDVESMRSKCIKNLQKHANPDVIDNNQISEEAELFSQDGAVTVENELISVDSYTFDDEDIDSED